MTNTTMNVTMMVACIMAALLLLLVVVTPEVVDAFSPLQQQQYHHDSSSSSSIGTTQRRRQHRVVLASTPSGGGSGSSNVERLQFKIYPDGRIEETVLGVKGGDCQKITEKINEALGEVISSQPTEEMFEQDIQIDQTLTNSNVENGGGGGDSWDGASSW